MLTLHAPTRTLDGIDPLRTPAEAVGATLYSLRAGQLVHVDTIQDRESGWTCQPLGPSHGRGCRVVLADVDLATALTPDRLTSGGHPDPDRDPAAYLAAWRCRVWQRHGAHLGRAADQLAAAASPPPPGSGGRPTALSDRDSVRRYALGAHMVPVGFQRLLAKLLQAGLLTPARLHGVGAVALTLPPRSDQEDPRPVELVNAVTCS